MTSRSIAGLTAGCKTLLEQLIAIPSFSREENDTADLLCRFLDEHAVAYDRLGNNLWAYNRHFDEDKPTILLNSHHDTVKPNPGYSRDPFTPSVAEGKLFGLGSNDAGGCLVSLFAAFLHYYDSVDLRYNLCLLASAEEEVSGKGGVEAAFPQLRSIACAIVGEPTLLNLAVAEKGLMVLDCEATGIAGHAAREEGENALYKAVQAIEWFRTFTFPKISDYLGPVKMSVTMIHAGSQHNVVPASCSFVVDVRTTDAYTNAEVLAIIRQHVDVSVTPRSTRLNPSIIPLDHPLVQSGLRLGATVYGSPTMSDQALLPVPSLKVGPGDSARSHAADEFIFLKEIDQGIRFYIDLLGNIL
ncbi:M20 family metallo-hydrolase [Sphingobacterium griseoflavum]|uniref:Acetylornithine deacetylase n=1 Tax=Sphingobacterium griseoflavum TaxID=1474952 RepID=A0ABQ3I0M9_9SPHI|nr:M20 family metallo-hydrolase [Sphingobacterium griseoflavum]GHE38092.1 acetylornithine deacetylase [Sphingobacterium griseoflavum]